MTTIGSETRPAYVYDSSTDTWIPIGVGPHTHEELINKTIITAKGDIIVGTSADSPTKLSVGLEGTYLKADPTSATGLSWGEIDAGSITVSETSPLNPEQGDLWFNSSNAVTYIYYDSFWVELSSAVAGAPGEAGASGVVSATSPITYNSETQTVGINQSAIAINMSQISTTVSDKSANYTLVSSDKNTYIRSTGSAITITVPDVLANGESVNFIQAGAGQITFLGSGITINSTDAKLKTNKQFSGASIVKLGGAYYLVGDLGA